MSDEEQWVLTLDLGGALTDSGIVILNAVKDLDPSAKASG